MNKKYDLKELQIIRRQWREVPIEAISEELRVVYENRKIAVDLYIDGENSKDIKRKTGIRGHLSELVDKCCKRDSMGNYAGYQALIPYNSTKKIFSNFCVGEDLPRGAFNTLLNTYPELRDFIIGCYYGDKKYTTEHRMSGRTLHKKFLQKLMELGVQDFEYPFNTTNLAYVSLLQFLRELDKMDVQKAAIRGNKDERQKINSTGYGVRYTKKPLAPFSVVQIDGHKLDIAYYIAYENEDSTIDKVMATRLWLLAVIDVATRTILGFSISQEENYNQYDVIEAIQNAILPRKRMEFKRIKADYPENGGFVSFAFPTLKYALFDTVMLDNAKSHLAENTVKRLTERLAISMNYGSVATPEARGIIERFFGSLETRGFHRLPMTTGSTPKDLKRKNPEKACIRYDITLEDITELLELLIAEYNTTPHSALNNLSPLECMKRRIFEAGMMPVIATERLRTAVDKLNFIVDTRIVRGGKNGKRAYINYNNAVYRSNELSGTAHYIGQKITIEINPNDVSTVDAYDENGNYIGKLRAMGEFGTKSHSLKTRKNAAKLSKERGLDKNRFSTPISDFEKQLNERAKKSRRDATKSDILRRELGKTTLFEQSENNSGKIICIDKAECPEVVVSDKNVNNMSKEEMRKFLRLSPDERINYLYKNEK